MRRVVSAVVVAAVGAVAILLGTVPSWASDTYSSCEGKGKDGKSHHFSSHGWGDWDDWKDWKDSKDFDDWDDFDEWHDWFDDDFTVEKKHHKGKDCWVVHHD